MASKTQSGEEEPLEDVANPEGSNGRPVRLAKEGQWDGDTVPIAYDVDHFYTFAKDEKKGIGRTISFRHPACWTHEIEKVLEQIADYEGTLSNFLRDAVYHRLRHLQRQGLKTSDIWEGITESDRMQDYLDKMNNWLNKIKTTKASLRSAKDRKKLQAYVERETERALRTEEPWSSRALAELRRRPPS